MEAKYQWLKRNFPELLERFYCVQYGDPKQDWVEDDSVMNILVDDNKLVREDWRKAGTNFRTINASRGYVKELVGLVG